ncbi:pseudouridine synthase [Megalodesulfovibrio gigas]|uniref:Pseudouridine synthase n=2 Tax=Megalodesulfovibrio gigas TaxID=879 RepID=T2G717_MEGG1|nr:pseudouridine synthase [Megalodesulfovibrio gigas]AAW67949.1 putative rRNA pseudouridine synthase B [Megalodesulfovibrio gigas]AGW11989.1 putative rRNA pseudouridine synthase B [Megalodesulfovibrio gigas DSM 1382 = ATCC 19364]
MDAIRLNKVLAQAGVASRRGADELVFAGRVRVNGAVAESPGMRVTPDDRIEVDGAPMPRKDLAAGHALNYILLHKPVEVVSTVRDPQGRRTVLDLLPQALRANTRLYPVGRLDYFSEGLLLLTDDGDLANRLMHPRHHVPKRYEVLVRGDVPTTALQTMRSGMTLPPQAGDPPAGTRLQTVPARILGIKDGKTLLELVLHQGVNRQVRRMCEALGLTILRLTRVGLGSLELGTLEKGSWRRLTKDEVQALQQA